MRTKLEYSQFNIPGQQKCDEYHPHQVFEVSNLTHDIMDIKAFVSLDVIPIDFLVANQVETMVGFKAIFYTHSTLGSSCYQGSHI
jgi:hypothetical protein